MFEFNLLKSEGPAGPRLGEIRTPRGVVETPVFMPVGTAATVKGMTPEEVSGLGARIILANVYHLHLRPGVEVIAALGGLHRFMNWNGLILTDSGGYQIFSLAPFRTIKEEGVEFRSHLDGARHFLTPERVVGLQEDLGADILICLDECPGYPAEESEVRRATELTFRWAGRSRAVRRRPDSALFAVVQGGMFPQLRREHARAMVDLGFEGYAIGGLSVGEPKELTREMLEVTAPELPPDKPRYLMGVGAPEDLVEAVARGVDMFDCVLPTRNARNGMAFTGSGRVVVRNARYTADGRPLEEGCGCYACRNYSRGYLRHLFMAKELLAYRLLTLHNLYYYLNLMARMREAIAAGRFPEFRRDFYQNRDSGGNNSD